MAAHAAGWPVVRKIHPLRAGVNMFCLYDSAGDISAKNSKSPLFLWETVLGGAYVITFLQDKKNKNIPCGTVSTARGLPLIKLQIEQLREYSWHYLLCP